MKDSSKAIYLIDTNILVQWLAALYPDVQSDNENFKISTAIRIQRFMEQDDRIIYVPDLVWAEFFGVILHKDMDVSDDLYLLKHWFQQRESYIQQMEGVIQRRHQFFPWPRLESPFDYATLLVRDFNLIDEKTFGWLSTTNKAKSKGKEKLLDGMDSVILLYLNALATLHPDQRVILYTADYRLSRILPRVREYHRDWFAQNTDAEFALQAPKTTGRRLAPYRPTR